MITAVKGMNDILPQSSDDFLRSQVWDFLFATATEVLSSYGYHRVILPVVEETALFARGIGEDTDIVSKEMYTFSDRGGRSLTLRPEGTAGAVRSYIENNLGRTDPVQRWWYAGPMFRAERPQKGRYRQFYQIGAEFFGVSHPASDAELLILLRRFCEALGLVDVRIKINTLGDDASRQRYREQLSAFLQTHVQSLCESCQRRVATNPLRVLDCKREGCQQIVADAPDMLDSLSDEAASHFAQVQQLLHDAGVEFHREKRLVRGLDYYTGLIFEFTTTALGAQDAILGGGRYDKLVEELGGPKTAAIGFGAGVERLALVLAQRLKFAPPIHLYIAPMANAESRAMQLADEVRAASKESGTPLRVEVDVTGGKLKAQMRRADKLSALAAIVLGEDELLTKRGRLKNLKNATETEIELSGRAIVASFSNSVAP